MQGGGHGMPRLIRKEKIYLHFPPKRDCNAARTGCGLGFCKPCEMLRA